MVERLPFIISRRGLASQNFLNRPRRALSARAPQSSRYVPGVPFETVSVTSEAFGVPPDERRAGRSLGSRKVRAECLDRLTLFGERRRLRSVGEFVAHYHGERDHQGLGNELISPGNSSRWWVSAPLSAPAGRAVTLLPPSGLSIWMSFRTARQHTRGLTQK